MILKEFYNVVRQCRTWNNDSIYHKVKDTVENVRIGKDVDFRQLYTMTSHSESLLFNVKLQWMMTTLRMKIPGWSITLS